MVGRAGMTPRQSIEAECARLGKPAVISACIDLLGGREVDDRLVLALGGAPAEYVLTGRAGGKDGYWPRVWAARGLLHAWDEEAASVIIRAASDDAWRVREMAAKVVARHQVDEALSVMVSLQDDPVARVRSAARRALAALTASRPDDRATCAGATGAGLAPTGRGGERKPAGGSVGERVAGRPS